MNLAEDKLVIFQNRFNESKKNKQDILEYFNSYLYKYYYIKIEDYEYLKDLYSVSLMMLFYIFENFENEDMSNNTISKELNILIFDLNLQYLDFKKTMIDSAYKSATERIFNNFYSAFLNSDSMFFIRRQIEIAKEEIKELIYKRIQELSTLIIGKKE